LGQGKAVTDNEVELLLAGARFEVRDRAILYLLLQSACRAGEAAGLQINNLDLDEGTAWIIGKGDVGRWIYFGEEAATALRDWLVVRPKVKHDFVFTGKREPHAPLGSASLSQIIRRLGYKVGLERTQGSHRFRHRVGSQCAKNRVPIRVAQAYLGHSSPNITFEYYQDVDEKDLRDLAKMLNRSGLPTSEKDRKRKQKAVKIHKRFRRLRAS